MTALLAALGWLDLAAAVVFVGGLIYRNLVGLPSRSGARARDVAAVILAIVLMLEFGLTTLRLQAVSDIRGIMVGLELLETRWGALWVTRSAGLAALVICRRRHPRSAAGLAALWLSLRSFQGHAGAHGTFPAIIDWLHLLAVTTWIGSLAQFALLRAAAAARAAARLRAVSTASLMLLLPAGIYGAFLYIPRLTALATTPYGRTLSSKLMVAAVLIGLGATNHFRNVPGLRAGDGDTTARLSRLVRIEVMIAVLVLLLSALLGVLPMPHGSPP